MSKNADWDPIMGRLELNDKAKNEPMFKNKDKGKKPMDKADSWWMSNRNRYS